MSTIKRGENAIIQRNLFASDGTTPLLLSSLSLLHAEIIQYNVVLATYVYLPTPNPVQDEIRQGSSTSQIEIEIKKELSLLFKEGDVSMKLIMEQTDAEYESDTVLRDIDESVIFTVEL
jgi:hypothetical protein